MNKSQVVSQPEESMHLSGFDASEYEVEQIVAKYATNLRAGLTTEEANSRRSRFGANEIADDDDESLLAKYLDKFKEPMILLLLGSAAVSILVGQFDDALSIFLAVVIVCTVGFYQEYKSDQALEKLKSLTKHLCTVVRDGEDIEIEATELVYGDVVKMKSGDRVAADIRLVEANNLSIEEAIFTGEAKPAKKVTTSIKQTKREEEQPAAAASSSKKDDSDSEDDEQTAINIKKSTHVADCKNIAFMGTLTSTGNGKGVVIGTGQNTELGKITDLLKKITNKKSPLQKNMDKLSHQISMVSFVIIGVIFIIGLFTGKRWLEMFTMGISLAVAAIPEGLPIVVTVTLAMGVIRMSSRKVVVRKLPSVETLGATSVICVDKTGTLTQNEMTVSKIFTYKDSEHFVDVTGVGYQASGEFCRYDKQHFSPKLELNHKQGELVDVHKSEEQHIKMLLVVGNVCNNATIRADSVLGQPTELSLLAAATKAGLEDQRKVWIREEEIPFSHEEKWMATKCTHATSKQTLYFVKGAVETVIQRCKHFYVGGEKQTSPLNAGDKDIILSTANEFASNSLRILTLAYGDNLDNLVFCGVVGIYDPPRPGVKESIRTLHQAGVKVVMITGDNKQTAVAIAKELGIVSRNADESTFALSVEDIESPQFKDKVDTAAVFYRVAPVHKMKIVEAFQAKEYVVGMTGDGVNDAPALKRADIGIAMGKSGTDVSKEAAEMVLMDDNFSSIMVAIEEGKSIFNNIKNFLRYQLTTSVSCMFIISICTLLGLPLPLNPMQILWINIIMDGPPAQSLGVEPADDDVMKQPPRNTKDNIISRKMIFSVVTSAIIMVVGTLYVFMREMNADGVVNARDTTVTFTTFVLFQLFNAFNCRSDKKSIFQVGFLSNKTFLLAVGGSLLGQVFMLYNPWMRRVFETEAISLEDWIFTASVASSVVIFDEIVKLVMRLASKPEPATTGAAPFKRNL